jgi:hypothetical protein
MDSEPVLLNLSSFISVGQKMSPPLIIGRR